MLFGLICQNVFGPDLKRVTYSTFLASSQLLTMSIVVIHFCDSTGMWSLSGSESVHVFLLFFFNVCIAVGDPVIKRGEVGGGAINLFYKSTFLCLSQARAWISNVICYGFSCVILVQLR